VLYERAQQPRDSGRLMLPRSAIAALLSFCLTAPDVHSALRKFQTLVVFLANSVRLDAGFLIFDVLPSRPDLKIESTQIRFGIRSHRRTSTRIDALVADRNSDIVRGGTADA